MKPAAFESSALADQGLICLSLGPVPLGGSWVVLSGVVIRVAIFMAHIKGLITLLITTHEPPSKP